MSQQLPNGKKSPSKATVRTVQDLGEIVQRTRKEQKLSQIDVAGLVGCGNRFIVDLEKGKETIRMQKAIDVLELLGLELVVVSKGQ